MRRFNNCKTYASANGTFISFVDRLFYSTPFDKTMKVGASVVAARRGGLSATFNELNKYFTISGMPVASGQYWNSIHGMMPGEYTKTLRLYLKLRQRGQRFCFAKVNFATHISCDANLKKARQKLFAKNYVFRLQKQLIECILFH